ncbi:MAG TPA: hypothetical protein VJR89_16245, partial [Polyangiales bacterium]|nr:hypothetical protein [Polyangiales bacterium]
MAPLSRLERTGVVLALSLAAAGLYAGWLAHWFLTDDAFIAFRFVDNRRLGYGYTWNPPPFVPVEGYTSFAWLVLLDGVWSAFGIEPPEVANWLALGCAFGSLALTAWAALRVCTAGGVLAGRVLLCACVLAGVASQRSVAIWASSGMETALWNLLLQAWVLCGLLGRPGPQLLAAECALATAAA